jgi:hypothetical protein
METARKLVRPSGACCDGVCSNGGLKRFRLVLKHVSYPEDGSSIFRRNVRACNHYRRRNPQDCLYLFYLIFNSNLLHKVFIVSLHSLNTRRQQPDARTYFTCRKTNKDIWTHTVITSRDNYNNCIILYRIEPQNVCDGSDI